MDSRKKEKTPSIASVCPMTPPAASEKRAQFVPNWNSIGMPVTTPIAKLIAKMRVQNRAARSYRSSPVRSATVFQKKMTSARPMVS